MTRRISLASSAVIFICSSEMQHRLPVPDSSSSGEASKFYWVKMERTKSYISGVTWVLLVCLVSQNVVIPVTCGSSEGKWKNNRPPHPGPAPACPKGTPPSPLVPVTPSTPPSPRVPVTPSTPPSPRVPVTPSTPPSPRVPVTPSTPPMIPDPNRPPVFPGTCIFWRTNPQLIWGIFGFWGATVGSVFGVAATPTLGQNLTLQQALANTRRDGIGALLREGTASLLNSMVSKKFPFTTQQVKDRFLAGLASDNAATAQASLFKQANEGRLKPLA